MAEGICTKNGGGATSNGTVYVRVSQVLEDEKDNTHVPFVSTIDMETVIARTD